MGEGEYLRGGIHFLWEPSQWKQSNVILIPRNEKKTGENMLPEFDKSGGGKGGEKLHGASKLLPLYRSIFCNFTKMKNISQPYLLPVSGLGFFVRQYV